MKNLLGVARGHDLRKYARSAYSPSLRLAGAFLQLLATIMVARTLGADEAGEFFFWSMVLITFGQVSTFGLDRLALQQLPRLREDPRKRSRFLATIRTSALAVALAFGILLMLYALILQRDIDRSPWWYLLPPMAVMGVALCTINGDAMIGMERPVLGVCFRHTLNTVLFACATGGLALASALSANSALLVFTLAFVVAGVAALMVPGFRSAGSPFAIPRLGEFSSLLKLGLPICLSSIFGAFAGVLPLAVLEQAHSHDQVAFLTTALRLYVLFEVLANAFHSFNLPELSRAALEEGGENLGKVYRNTLLMAAVFIVPGMLVMAVFAGPVMNLFGEEFGEGASVVLQTLLGFGIVSVLCGPANHLVLMLGRTKSLARISFLRLAGTAILALLLVDSMGPVGIAIVFGIGLLTERFLCLGVAIVARRSASVVPTCEVTP